jgi:hypothetical protein
VVPSPGVPVLHRCARRGSARRRAHADERRQRGAAAHLLVRDDLPDASALGVANPKTTDLVGGSIFQYAHPTVDDIAGARPPFVDASVDPGQPFKFAVSTYGQFQFTD